MAAVQPIAPKNGAYTGQRSVDMVTVLGCVDRCEVDLGIGSTTAKSDRRDCVVEGEASAEVSCRRRLVGDD